MLAVLVGAALVIGATGTWSPCGFSMIETIGPTGHTGGRRTTLAACATFLPGALVGAIATFGLLGAAGALVHGAAGAAAYAVAAALALCAAALEARGTPILPQVRRQLPEHWRRVLPMPLASALYGVLLGLGFTTFVLTYGVWALMGIAFAIGEAQAGILAGLAFGVGRALPIVALAPLAGTPAGTRVTELMAARPGLYRGVRLGDAVALAALAVVLAGAVPAAAERVEEKHAADPSAQNRELVFQRADRSGILRRGGETTQLPGKDPAIGGPYIAVRQGTSIGLLGRRSLQEIRTLHAGKGLNAVAVSSRWIVWRSRPGSADVIYGRRISNVDHPGDRFRIARSGSARLSAPSVHGSTVVFAKAGKGKNTIIRRRLPAGRAGNVVASRKVALMTPSVRKGRLLYVRLGKGSQQLVLRRLGTSNDRVLYRRGVGNGILYTTSLGAGRAYAGLFKGSSRRIVSVAR